MQRFIAWFTDGDGERFSVVIWARSFKLACLKAEDIADGLSAKLQIVV